jgi:hypothetical protein
MEYYYFGFAPIYTHEGMEYNFICECPSLYSWGYGVYFHYLYPVYTYEAMEYILFVFAPF